jgi:hypothetical protein
VRTIKQGLNASTLCTGRRVSGRRRRRRRNTHRGSLSG